MKGSKEYKKAIAVRDETKKNISNENKDIKFENIAKGIHGISTQTCVSMTKIIMLQYSRYIKEHLPLELIDKFAIPGFGIIADFKNISALSFTEEFSRHKTRNSILRAVFGKAEHYDALSDLHNNNISIEEKEYEILEHNKKMRNVNERLRIITKLRHMLEDNQYQLEKMGHYNMTEEYLFTMYSGIKIFEVLSNIIMEGTNND